MASIESLLFWLSTTIFSLTFFLSCIEIIFGKSFLRRIVDLSLYMGFAVQTAFLLLRWKSTGHFPYVTSFESVVISCWFLLLIYIILKQVNKEFRIIGAAVFGFVFLLLGYSTTLQSKGESLSIALQTIWLTIHAFFATSGVATLLTGAACAVICIKIKDKSPEDVSPTITNAPSIVPNHSSLSSNHSSLSLRANSSLSLQANSSLSLQTNSSLSLRAKSEAISNLMSKFTLLGFIFWSVMIVSGSIWANLAWGRYWGWDPIEVWSLITWLIYAAYFHLPFLFPKFKKYRAHFLITAVIIAVFALWGVGKFYKTIHFYG